MKKNKVFRLFQNTSFRKKLVITYAVLIIIPITALGLFSVWQTRRLLFMQMESEHAFNARQVANSLKDRLEKDDGFIRFTTFSPYLMEDFNGRTQDWFSITQKINRYFEPVSWYNVSINRDFKQMKIYFEYLDQTIGTFIAPGSSVSEESWYREIRDYAQTRWMFENGTLYARRRIFNAILREFIGAITMEMNIDHILEELALGAGKAGKKQYVLITDSSGSILCGDPFAIELLSGEAYDSVDRELMVNASGAQYYIAKTPVEGFDWLLAVVSPIEAYNLNVGNILLFSFLLIVLCIGVLFSLIWFFSLTLVRPIKELSRQMVKVEDGDYSLKTHSDSTDEIGVLTNRFGHMVEKTNEYINQIVQSERALREEEIKSLQAQISPHFLYNLLSHINWRAYERNDLETSEMAILAADFYRSCLNSGAKLTSVGSEIESMKAYISLQNMMHDETIQVTYEIEERALDVKTVNFAFQPLVENAIIHGLDERCDGLGRLRIFAIVEDSVVRLGVEDNGVGIARDRLSMLLEGTTSGYGLHNVNRRMKLHFGDSFGLRISSTPGIGTCAELIIPL
jgi:two-component system sensor histidine kinase YesM